MSLQETAPAMAFSLALHALIVAILVISWSASSTLVKPVVPAHIKAVVVERPAPPVKPAPVVKKPAVTKPAVKPAPAKPRPEPAPAARPTPTPKPPDVATPVAPARSAPQFPQPDIAEHLAREEILLDQTRPVMTESVNVETTADQAMAPDTHADAERTEFMALIRQEIERRWVRPPSARSGMQADLRLRLVPGGEVLDVTLMRSSGDAAFDRSALSAVRNAGRLPVPSEPQQFEPFRDFILTFRPENLRR